MRYFVEVKVIEEEPGWNTTPRVQSIGIVAEDGREYAAYLHGLGHTSVADVAEEIAAFCDAKTYGPPEVWTYDPEETWAAVKGFFGNITANSLKAEAAKVGSPTLPERPTEKQSIRASARWSQGVWFFLARYAGKEPAQAETAAEEAERTTRRRSTKKEE